jgi:hypothetical protein
MPGRPGRDVLVAPEILSGSSQSGHALDCGDNLAREGVTVFRGRGKGLFENVTLQYGLGQPTFALRVGTKWFDYDSDGRLDLFIATGAVSIVESMRGGSNPYGQRNLLFHNEGWDRKLREASDVAGPAFQR